MKLVENPTDETGNNSSGEEENTDGNGNAGNDTDTEDVGQNTEIPNEDGNETGNTDNRTSTSIVGKLNYVLDEANKTAVTKPVGAKVYIDDVYIGTVPVEFEKILEPFVLVLKSGDREKSYTITPDDNDEDAVYSFPDI